MMASLPMGNSPRLLMIAFFPVIGIAFGSDSGIVLVRRTFASNAFLTKTSELFDP